MGSKRQAARGASQRRSSGRGQKALGALPGHESSGVVQSRAAAEAAEALGRFMADTAPAPDSLVALRVGSSEQALEVPPSALGLLRDALGELAEGHEVELLGQEREVGTVFAARLLGVSRPYFVKLLEEEHAMAFHKVGRDRRVALSDVLAYRHRLTARRSAAMRELVRHSEDIGLYNGEQ